MKWSWWKIASIILLSWTILGGMLAPLRPGITTVTPDKIKAGQKSVVKVSGYNTHWGKALQATAWLHIGEKIRAEKNGKPFDSIQTYAIKSLNFKPLDEQTIEFTFDVPAYLPLSTDFENASILVDVDGKEQAIRPAALMVEQDSMNAAVGKSLWAAPMGVNRAWSFSFPYRNLLYETIRNTWFHVPMWFVMLTLFGVGVFHAVKYLRGKAMVSDINSASYTLVGVLFGFLGLFSGGLWANYTWGEPFPRDIKLIMTYTCLAIYLAYFVLRAGFDSPETRARVSAVYSIFAFMMIIPLIYVVPKLVPDSLHPGNGGNPAFGSQDMDNTMRLVFYPAVLGWTMLGIWIASLVRRYRTLEEKILEKKYA